MQGHKANLDLLRATAIVVVLVHHISQFLTGMPVFWQKTAALGAFGVDLFFVLSGWLIGGIYFREHQAMGRVQLARFWGRRWLRTMPPYYVVLLLSWLAVYVSRQQAFDTNFLFFLQNYSPIPRFFLVSWSLCIEEHFYIFLPLVLYVGLRFNAVIPTCIALIISSLLMRLQVDTASFPAFGYSLTATHLRLDGLSLGVLCAYVCYVRPVLWSPFSSTIIWLGYPAGVSALLLYFLDSPLMYSVGILALSLFFTGLLCQSVNAPDWSVSRLRIVWAIAVSSYSVYLTHALAIHLTRRYIADAGIAFIGGSLLLTAGIGFVFYTAVEGTAKQVRDRLLPHPGDHFARAYVLKTRDTVRLWGQKTSRTIVSVTGIVYRRHH